MVDWDGDGYYSGENEVTYMVNLSLSRGRDHFIDSSGQGFERYSPGQATIILDNTTGRFNPFNTSSPLYPYVTPGKSCRILVQEGSGGDSHSLMRGRIADIQPYNQGNRKMVKIDVVDGQQFLAGRTVKIGINIGSDPPGTFTEVRSTGWWVDLILERAGWPEAEWPRTYDQLTDYTGNVGADDTENFYTLIQYAWMWLRDAMEGIREFENVELGTFLHDREGNARFLSQHFTYDQIIELDESQLLKDINTPQPWETLRNRIEVVVNPIDVHEVDGIIGAGTGTELLWRIGGTAQNAIPVASEDSFVVEASFRWQNFSNIVPVNTFIDFEVNTLANGTGTDLTSQCTVQVSEMGNGATVTLLNNSASDGYILLLAVYGDAIYAEFESVATAEDQDSIAIYGTRAFRLTSPWMQEPAYAQEIADFLLEQLKDPTQYPAIRIENRPDIQFGLDLYVDAVHLTCDTLDINRLYRIGKIEHSWLQPTGQATLTTLKLEPYYAVGADTVFDCTLSSPFDSTAETDCSGSPAAGRMEWCLDTGWSWGATNGVDFGGGIRCDLSNVNTIGAYTNAASLSHTVILGQVVSFKYRWNGTNGGPGGSLSFRITMNSGDIVNVVPYEAIVTGEWRQMIVEVPDVGSVITELRFTKPATFVQGGNLYIDNVCIGVIIG